MNYAERCRMYAQIEREQMEWSGGNPEVASLLDAAAGLWEAAHKLHTGTYYADCPDGHEAVDTAIDSADAAAREAE